MSVAYIFKTEKGSYLEAIEPIKVDKPQLIRNFQLIANRYDKEMTLSEPFNEDKIIWGLQYPKP